MLLVAWSIAVLIAIALVVIAFCLICGMIAEQKGRSWWWAVMGVFTVFGLIVVLLLDRSIASEIDRRIAVERAYRGGLSSHHSRQSMRSSGVSREERRSSQSMRSSGLSREGRRSSGARAGSTGNPVGVWLAKGSGPSKLDTTEGVPGHQSTGASGGDEDLHGQRSPVDSFLTSGSGSGSQESEEEPPTGD